jgi:restriction system protein
MAIPVFWEFFHPILESLKNDDVLAMEDIECIIVPSMQLSPEELSEMTSGGTRTKVKDRIYWGKSYLKAAGLVRYPKRGSAQITKEGKKVLKENPQPFDINYLKKYESFRKFIGISTKDGDRNNEAEVINDKISSQTPQDSMDSAFLEINSTLRNEILSELTGGESDNVTREQARFFEKLVVKLLMKMGYGGVLDGEGVVTPFSGDGGVDGVIREDKLGFSNIYIQAKCYSLDKTIGRPDIEQFLGAIYSPGTKALFVTTAKFSQAAKDKAVQANLVLVDGEKLADLMIEYGVGVSTIQTYEIKKLDSDFFEER